MKQIAAPLLVVSIFFLGGSTGLARYKIKDLNIKPAQEYVAHQDFQNLVIAAYDCDTEAKTLELFDTDKLHKREILPVLVVVENNNDFAIGIHERDFVLVTRDGTNLPSLPYASVLLHISLDKPLSSYSTQQEMLLLKTVDKEMILDFEHKAFGEKLIAPDSSDSGIVFFMLPEKANLPGARLYLPEIINFSDKTQLMFFEFELGRPQD